MKNSVWFERNGIDFGLALKLIEIIEKQLTILLTFDKFGFKNSQICFNWWNSSINLYDFLLICIMFVNTKCKCNGHTTKNNHLTAAKNKRIMIGKDVGAWDSKLKWRVPISKSPLKSIAHTIRINWNDILVRINYHQRHLHVKCQFESQPLCTSIGCGGRMGCLFWHRVGVGVSLYTFRMQIEWRQRNDQSNMNLILHLFSSRYKNAAAHLNWNIFLSSPFISFPSQIDNRNIFHGATIPFA